MPLSEKARIEVYLPDLPQPAYQDLLDVLITEFTCGFGGATVLRGLDGSYLSQAGLIIRDRINLIYTDTPLPLSTSHEKLSRYVEKVRETAIAALNEEAVLVAVLQVHHGQ